MPPTHKSMTFCLCLPVYSSSALSKYCHSTELLFLSNIQLCKPSKAMAMSVFFFLLCVSLGIGYAFPHPDKIIQLPGQPLVGFQHFSGYVTVDDKKQRALFYYFVEAETDPASKPLVLWLNGGPGCSSVGVGAFSENGPFRPRGQVLVKNEHSWNKEANMLYLESPVGVGFSYSTNTSSYETVNDEITARDNVVFLQRWFNKFPQYRNNNLFLTGESYAGHYVPQLAKLMIELNNKKKVFNLKGVALGNPVLEFATDFNSRAEYFWSHGLISDSTYRMFTSVCNYSRYVSEYYRENVSPMCSRVMSLVSRETSKFVDKYDVTLDVCMSSVLSQSKIISPQESAEKIDVCIDDETVNYLNRQDVRRALHARLVGVRSWDVCSTILDYQLLDIEMPTISIVGLLVEERIPVLIYSGDQDSVVPLTGSRSVVHQLAKQMGLNTTVPYRVWFAGQQVGGWTQVYDNILSFATIRGAAHEAPFSQPERSLVLFKSFLQGRPLPELFE
ncbi:serine carboxypeptidase-like 45 [Capsicum chacoense]|uniref:Carboxypeptidase n=1 Tax=Capsicum annuum TaxID=4072 RepID=A0A2G2ZBY4_CAPAN|nr:serine carboxypeptidase-like 45 [Capsicum annuum]PHT79513.1 Serine carboxypeptidase-like 45 [Capsicum annuum]